MESVVLPPVVLPSKDTGAAMADVIMDTLVTVFSDADKGTAHPCSDMHPWAFSHPAMPLHLLVSTKASLSRVASKHIAPHRVAHFLHWHQEVSMLHLLRWYRRPHIQTRSNDTQIGTRVIHAVLMCLMATPA
jgi:hypothetical protein